MARRTMLLLALLGVLAACRVDVTADLVLGADGTGELVVTATGDAELVQQTPGLAADLRFDDAAAAGWVVEGPSATADGGLTVTLRHPVTSAADATNLLASLGPPFTDVSLERTSSPDGTETTVVLSGQLVLPAGFDSFADSDLLASIGASPYADDLAAAGATPASSMSVTLNADLPGEIEETNGTERDGVLGWVAPLDGSSATVLARAEQRPAAGGGWAGVLATIALVILVLWVVVAAAFIVSVARARSRRAKARRARQLR